MVALNFLQPEIIAAPKEGDWPELSSECGGHTLLGREKRERENWKLDIKQLKVSPPVYLPFSSRAHASPKWPPLLLLLLGCPLESASSSKLGHLARRAIQAERLFCNTRRATCFRCCCCCCCCCAACCELSGQLASWNIAPAKRANDRHSSKFSGRVRLIKRQAWPPGWLSCETVSVGGATKWQAASQCAQLSVQSRVLGIGFALEHWLVCGGQSAAANCVLHLYGQLIFCLVLAA